MTRKFLAAAVVLFAVLMAVVAFMGWRAKNEIELVVTDQFNGQQLLLAEKIAADIDEHFEFLKTSLRSLSEVWRGMPADSGSPVDAISPFFQMLKHWKVLAMGFARGMDGPPEWFDASGELPGDAGLDTKAALAFALDPARAGAVYVGRVVAPRVGPFAGRRLVLMAAGVSSKTDTHTMTGVILLVLDAMAVAREYAHGVRSGESGYAWVVDDQGYFLDHYEEQFLGQHSIETRRERNPELDWSRIEWLLRERILTGQKGTDWYVSGWHRGVISEMRKLAAFCPAFPSGDDDQGNVWGVCLAAPESEVQGLIGRLVIREWLVVVLFEAVVFFGFVVAMWFSLRFSRMLGAEVERKKAELVKAQEKLIRSERFAAIGQAAAHLSHEIKNPLMLMSGFARQVRRTLADDDKNAEKLRIVEEEARRLEAMLNEVRDFSRPVPPRIELGDIGVTVEETVRMMTEGLKTRGVRVTFEAGRGIPLVPHDAGRLRQVLINLMKNAAEAMPEGGEVRVSTDFADGFALVTVSDNGPGIPPDVASRMFEPFCTTKESGTGLGLAVCQRIIEDHKGEIGYVTSPGKGTRFTIRLPV
ncbi:PAS domain-containing sensor histidine kinase [Desulfolutivibrio sulfoxidireducens]|uniref:sensor histidine kinase n=1 Tax=Desulfolutivibrio sulfoxidireducens TaxID=2773299 RepID=UPI00159E31AC|nr:PAS domain-containing sensor histidine kinase [Desulfolutivibrio sulfoxidireducens]QLA21350.1 sensor histidine kinase [Desulfolutivibrio sulfoxidireducens]